MAFKGGFLLKPTQTGVENLGALYLNGIKAIEDKKKKIKEEDDALLKESKSAVNIPTTGISNYDTEMAKYGMSVQQGIQDLYGKLQRGEINRDDYRLALVGAKTSAELMSKYPEIIAKQHADINKGIEEGKLSDINREIHAGRFKDINGSPDNRTRSIEAFFKNGRSFIAETYSVDSGDEGDEVKSRTIDITELADPNKILYNRFDLQKEIENFTKTLNEEGVIEVKSQAQPDGTVVRQVIKDPSKSRVVANNINRRINLVDQNSLVDVLYKLGARAEHFSDFKRPTKEDLGNRLGSKTSIDKDGSSIFIEPEDLVLDVSTNGKVNLTNKQLDIARGIVRASMYGSLGVDTRVSIEEPKVVEPKKEELLQKLVFTPASVDSFSLSNIAINQLKKVQGVSVGKNDLPSKIQQAITTSNADMFGASVPLEYSQDVIKATGATSFSGNELNSVNSIVVTKTMDEGPSVPGGPVRERYNIMLVGPSTIGQAEESIKTEGQGRVSMGSSQEGTQIKRTSEITAGVSMTPPLEELQAQSLYLLFYKNNEQFRKIADDKNFKSDGDKNAPLGQQYQKAFFTIYSRLGTPRRQ